jgi:hypothetical protein
LNKQYEHKYEGAVFVLATNASVVCANDVDEDSWNALKSRMKFLEITRSLETFEDEAYTSEELYGAILTEYHDLSPGPSKIAKLQ